MSHSHLKEIDIDFRGKHYKLSRLDDGRYYEIWQNSLPIADDYRFYMQFYLYLRDTNEELNLARIYVTLENLCGKSGKSFDDWKGSFSFPFLLQVSKDERKFDYLLNIHDHRGSLYFGIRKLLQPDDRYDKAVIHQPLPDEFSREEINEFICYFYGYLEGYFETIQGNYNRFFFNRIDSNCILYGYKDGEFFEEHYNSSEEYEEAVKLLEDYTFDSKL